MKPTLPFAQLIANAQKERRLEILHKNIPDGVTNLYTEDFVRQQQEKLTKYELRHAEQRKRIEELEAKTLTDEEMKAIYKELFGLRPLDKYAVEFARAILRKANEK